MVELPGVTETPEGAPLLAIGEETTSVPGESEPPALMAVTLNE